MTSFAIPSDRDFLIESERFLKICNLHCRCKNGWHFIWSAYKAGGKRRSIYFQQPLLKKLLASITPSVRRILIAGAADSGILSVLSSIFDTSVTYVAFDACDAPLFEMERYASANGLSVRCFQSTLQDFVATETFDLVFIHNTLCFVSEADATRSLYALSHAVSPSGWLVCGMRYEMGDFAFGGSAAIGLRDELLGIIQRTYADRPELLNLVTPHIDAYSAEKIKANLPRYQPADFDVMAKTCGLICVDKYTDTLTPPSISSMVSQHSDIRADVHLLRREVTEF